MPKNSEPTMRTLNEEGIEYVPINEIDSLPELELVRPLTIRKPLKHSFYMENPLKKIENLDDFVNGHEKILE